MNINDLELNSFDSEWRRKRKTLTWEVNVELNINDHKKESFSSDIKLQIIPKAIWIET